MSDLLYQLSYGGTEKIDYQWITEYLLKECW